MLFSMRTEAKSVRLEDLHKHFKDWSSAEMMAIEAAYSEVAWFRAAIDHRANAFSNVPFDLMEIGGDVIANENDYEDELSDNPIINVFRVLAQLITDIDLYGEAYADYETNGYGLNGAWRRLHPTSIRRVYDTMGNLLYFERRTGGKLTPIELDDPEFFWLWMPDRRIEYYPGEGVGKTALRAATTISNTDIFQATFFKNGALNPTILKVKGWATQDKAEKEKVEGVLRRMMTGIANAFKLVPLDADVDAVNLMQNLKDMAMIELTQQQRENISTATGVPHSLLFSNAANYATSLQDDFNFYDKTIVPFAVRVIEQQLNERFFKRFGLRLKYRKERMEVYQRIEIEKADKLIALYREKLIDGNEVRLQIGFPERKDDEFEVPARLVAPEAETGNQEEELPATDKAEEDEEYSQVKTDLQKWERMAIKRLSEKKPEKALEFASEYIAPVQKAAIMGALGVAQSADDVKAIFAEAATTAPLWGLYG